MDIRERLDVAQQWILDAQSGVQDRPATMDALTQAYKAIDDARSILPNAPKRSAS